MQLKWKYIQHSNQIATWIEVLFMFNVYNFSMLHACDCTPVLHLVVFLE